MKNTYIKNAKISEAEFRQILKLFSLEMEAAKIAEFMGINRVTVNRILSKIRTHIAEICESESPLKNGEPNTIFYRVLLKIPPLILCKIIFLFRKIEKNMYLCKKERNIMNISYKTTGKAGFFDKEFTSKKLSKLGNPLEKLHKVID